VTVLDGVLREDQPTLSEGSLRSQSPRCCQQPRLDRSRVKRSRLAMARVTRLSSATTPLRRAKGEGSWRSLKDRDGVALRVTLTDGGQKDLYGRTREEVLRLAEVAWRRLRDMEFVLARQPAVARAVRRLPLGDQLELTLELLRQSEWPQFDNCEELPPNVVRFRPRIG
jgi:hypothetical protein